MPAKHDSANTQLIVEGRPLVAGIGISHPDRVIYPKLGVTKLEFARYFATIAHWMLPHVAGRPLTLVHCPSGVNGTCRFLKHAKAWGPSALRRIRIQEKTKTGEYLVADSAEAVVSLAQMGVVEIHTWNSTAEDLERPNRIVWDLDPGPSTRWTDVVAGARLLRRVLRAIGLEAWVKTTGGRGLHVVVPIRRGPDWSECLDFARAVSDAVVDSSPALYTTQFLKRGREDKILFDYLRNNRTNTTICAFSPRARDGAPVSVPIDWADLDRSRPDWTLSTVVRRLHRLRDDPWRRYWTSSQRLTGQAVRAVKAL
jgi:bifunctional non-homologous end joining protein LigD